MKKTLAALALAGSIALIGSAPAVAATYPPLPPTAGVDDGTVAPGETFTFTGQGFLAGETVTVTITVGLGGGANAGGAAVSARIPVYQAPQTLGATADAQGKIAVPLNIAEPGSYSITATGNTSGVTVGPVRVVVAPGFANGGAAGSNAGGATGASLANTGGSSSTALANTGADSGLVLWTLVGAGALAAGATSVVVVRRRAKAEAAV